MSELKLLQKCLDHLRDMMPIYHGWHDIKHESKWEDCKDSFCKQKIELINHLIYYINS